MVFIVLYMVLSEWSSLSQTRKKKSFLLFKINSVSPLPWNIPAKNRWPLHFAHNSIVVVVVFYIIYYIYIYSCSLWAPEDSELSLFIGLEPGMIKVYWVNQWTKYNGIIKKGKTRRPKIGCYFPCPLLNVKVKVFCRKKSYHILVSMISYLWNHCLLHQIWKGEE